MINITVYIYISIHSHTHQTQTQNIFAINFRGPPIHCHLADDRNMKPSVSLYSFCINSLTISCSSLIELAFTNLYFRCTLIMELLHQATKQYKIISTIYFVSKQSHRTNLRRQNTIYKSKKLLSSFQNRPWNNFLQEKEYI